MPNAHPVWLRTWALESASDSEKPGNAALVLDQTERPGGLAPDLGVVVADGNYERLDAVTVLDHAECLAPGCHAERLAPGCDWLPDVTVTSESRFSVAG